MGREESEMEQETEKMNYSTIKPMSLPCCEWKHWCFEVVTSETGRMRDNVRQTGTKGERDNTKERARAHRGAGREGEILERS